jgi:hypothetical protein
MEDHVLIVTFGIVIALVAAVRSTWSPCGLSMLSQLTPMAEAGRGRAFGKTAAWFVAGAMLGGCTLGAAIAVGADLCAASRLGTTAAVALVAISALAAAAVDARVLGFGPPFVRRQVNQDWLLEYRSWVYGGGFGWQIGAGITTYVMTAAVPLMIVIGVLGARPAAAFGIGLLFGFVRGLAVLLTARLRSPAALTSFHRRFAALAEPVRRAVIAVEVAVAVSAAWIATSPPVAVVVTLAAVAMLGRTLAPRTHARSTDVTVRAG